MIYTVTSSQVIRQLLIDRAHVPNNMTSDWAMSIGKVPGTGPARLLTIYDTSPIPQGTNHRDKETEQLFGNQIRARSTGTLEGAKKLQAILVDLRKVVNQVVTIDGRPVKVHAVHPSGWVNPIGFEENGQRALHTINVLASLTEM